MIELEKEMEEKLIAQLCLGASQWKYREDIHTEKELWDNFRDKLTKNNIAILNGQDITDNEFRKIQAFINEKAITPYTAGCWLAGENGVAQIPLVRDDVTKGTISLKVIDNREVAGGGSSYEVINQYCQDKDDTLDKDRRFDVTLLINGMPMIQIELKNRQHPFMDAFRQIKKYDATNNFRGLFGLIQMFVVTNGVDTKYIAADTVENLNEKFLTGWMDKDNLPVTDYLDFAKEVLSIPAAHNMVGKYSVMDKTREKVILLRPYQIHAIEAIRKASYKSKSGFIWHTTGSGKTLTSYNVTKNLLDIPSIDKTLFLIDRRDLDTQTTTEFQSYAETDSIDVDETESTYDLERKLLDNRKQAIVTTIQKLQIIMKRYSEKRVEEKPKLKPKYDKLRSLRIAFIVDECHRTVTAETKRILERYFSDSLWYGFTGTPIFGENKKNVKGDLPDTTEKLYGECLHDYTIKDAIRNKNVLGFNIEYKDNYTDDGLRDFMVQYKIDSLTNVMRMQRKEMEQKILSFCIQNGREFYDNIEHKKEVVRYILNKCGGKFNLNKGEGKTYDALLTVRSIAEAQEYYRLFKKMVEQGEVVESIRSKLLDFPKIAITYTVGENQDGDMANQEEMKQSLADYNAMFGTQWSLEDGLKGYNTDLQDRIARKKSKFKDRKEQLDLVIVVDRLLTGFDAPCLSTLFVDRPPMPPQNIIQAFSRTNRIFDNTKIDGQIVIFRSSGIYKEAVDNAIYLYSNGGTPSDVMAPTLEEMKAKLKSTIENIQKIAKNPNAIELDGETDTLTAFAKAYQELDHVIAAIEVYTDWDHEELKEKYALSDEELEAYEGKYHNVIEELKVRKDGGDPDNPDEPVTIPNIDIEYELESTSKSVINYRYIVALMQRYVPTAGGALLDEDDEKNAAVIKENLEKMAKSNPKLTDILQEIWERIRQSPYDYIDVSVDDLVKKNIERTVEKKAIELSVKWCADVEEILFHARKNKEDDELMDLKLDYIEYKRKNPDCGIKLEYLDDARTDIKNVIREDIAPLYSLFK